MSRRICVRLPALSLAGPPPARTPTAPMLPQDFIVCFTSYVRADRAHRIVHDALRGQHGAPAGWWRVLPRRGPAYRLPSDFAVVRLQGLRRAQRRRALRALRRHSSVRLLSPERRYGPAEPKLSKHLQSLHDEADRHRHSEPAELGEQAPPHPPAAACDAACSADRTSATGRRLGRGRPVDRFPSSAGDPSSTGRHGHPPGPAGVALPLRPHL